MSGEMQVGPNLLPIAPHILVVIVGAAALCCEMLRRPGWSLAVTVFGLLAATGLAASSLGTDTTVFQGTYRVDALSLWAVIVLAPSTAMAALLARRELAGSDREGTFYSLLVFATVGALALAGAGDIMFLVLGVLIASLGSFALVAYPRDGLATEAALKYFVFGSVSEAVMIFGLTFWFGATGSTMLADLSRLNGSMQLAAVAGLAGTLTGLGYKAAIAPFHFWAPDAYQGAPIAAAAYLSVVPKIGAIFGLAQVARDLPLDAANWRLILAVLAVLSMTYGNLGALVQTNVVRLLGYSSIAQAGFFLLGVAAVGASPLAVQSLVLFAAAYAAMNLGAFAVVDRIGAELQAFAGAGRTAPWLGAAMTVFLLSLVGVPPLGGFVGKLLLFGAALDAGLAWLAVVSILNSVLSLAVYLRIIVALYQPVEKPLPAVGGTIVWPVSLVCTVAIGLGAQVLVVRM